MDFETARRILLALPGVEEGPCYGTPGFRVRRKFLARLKEDGETLVVKIDMEERDFLIRAAPETFYITDHYKNYPSVLIRLPAITPDALEDLLERAWSAIAPKKLAATRRGGSSSKRR